MTETEEFLKLTEIPNSLFEEIVQNLARFSIGFLRLEDTPNGQDAILLGSGTLVAVGETRAILTAHHVVRALPRTGRLGLILSPTLQQYTIDTQGLTFLEIDRGTEDSTGPDLGAVILSASIVGSIAAKKTFYNLDRHRDAQLNSPLDRRDGVWFVHGFIDEMTVEEPGIGKYSRVKRFYNLSGAGAPEAAVQVGEYDYFAFPVNYDARSVAPISFGGMSGGGLWQVPLTRNDQRALVHRTPLLSGVVFYQEPTTETQCGVKCHGPISVYRIAYDAIRAKLT